MGVALWYCNKQTTYYSLSFNSSQIHLKFNSNWVITFSSLINIVITNKDMTSNHSLVSYSLSKPINKNGKIKRSSWRNTSPNTKNKIQMAT